jgi:integrase
VESTPISKRTQRPLDASQVEGLLVQASRASASSLYTALVATLLEVGEMPHLVLGLTPDDARRTDRGWALRIGMRSCQRWVLLSPATSRELDGYLAESPLRTGFPMFRDGHGKSISVARLSRHFQKWARAAGIADLTGGVSVLATTANAAFWADCVASRRSGASQQPEVCRSSEIYAAIARGLRRVAARRAAARRAAIEREA